MHATLNNNKQTLITVIRTIRTCQEPRSQSEALEIQVNVLENNRRLDNSSTIASYEPYTQCCTLLGQH